MPVLVKRTSGIIEPVPYFKFPAGEVHIRNFDVSDITQIILNWRGDHTDLAVRRRGTIRSTANHLLRWSIQQP